VAVEQGKAAGANMAGESQQYAGSVGMNSLEFFGLAVVSLGVYKAKAPDPSITELILTDTKASRYKKIILKDNTIIGAILVGDIRNSGVYLRLMRERIDVGAFKDKLLEETFGYPTVRDLFRDKERIYV
jgi:NAD(P)H-nitrite reductase large subunit